MNTTKSLLVLAAALLVTPWAARADSDTDSRIEHSLKNSYNYRSVLNGEVGVSVDNGVVTLTGTVKSDSDKSLAENTANGIPDVTRVENKLTVDSSAAPEHSDGWIAARVKGALLFHSHVSATKTHVDVRDGEVTLTGTAASEAQKELTDQYVKDIDGVTSVKNDLTVETPSADDHMTRTTGDKIDDSSITAQVKYELLVHHSTSAVETKVKTDNGVVMITGEAKNAAERDLVTKLARDVRGVVSVDNQMTLKSDM